MYGLCIFKMSIHGAESTVETDTSLIKKHFCHVALFWRMRDDICSTEEEYLVIEEGANSHVVNVTCCQQWNECRLL